MKVAQISRSLVIGLSFLTWLLPFPSCRAAQADPANDPASVLKDILVASCSQDAKQFATHLTARNATAFAAMTTTAQSTLLKRFVLLDQPGSPHSQTDPAGNLVVLCATSSVTTQLQIGKPEIRDNVAYLPLSVKEAGEGGDADSRRVVMGLVRENNQWKLLSLGLLLLDLPTLAEEWDRAEIQTNEKAAIAAVKELATAIEKYRVTFTRLPQTLAELGPAKAGAAKNERAGLVDADLAAGHKDGYSFRYVIVGANDVGAPALYELAAIPTEYGRTGTRSFFRDSSGVLHAADHQGAVGTIIDPRVEQP
ncbi:MAG: hypothetical protein WBR26_19645 [Candidatus Acidiferrum sp.]